MPSPGFQNCAALLNPAASPPVSAHSNLWTLSHTNAHTPDQVRVRKLSPGSKCCASRNTLSVSLLKTRNLPLHSAARSRSSSAGSRHGGRLLLLMMLRVFVMPSSCHKFSASQSTYVTDRGRQPKGFGLTPTVAQCSIIWPGRTRRRQSCCTAAQSSSRPHLPACRPPAWPPCAAQGPSIRVLYRTCRACSWHALPLLSLPHFHPLMLGVYYQC